MSLLEDPAADSDAATNDSGEVTSTAPAVDLSKFMAVSKGRPSPLAVVKGDGGFWRKGTSGPPMVSAPDGRIAKSGKFAGQTAHVQYGSVENFADLICDMHDADAQACRDVVLGLGANPALMAEAVEFAQRDDIDESSGKRDGNAIAGRCQTFAHERRQLRRSDAVYETERLETLERRDFLLRTLIGVMEGHPVEAESELVTLYGLDTAEHAPVVTYSRASKTAELISDKHAVHKWDWRKIMEGIGRDPELADECRRLGNDPRVGEPLWNEAVDALCAKARVAAKANKASSQGTHAHALTEDYDLDRDWIALAAEGVDLGVPIETAGKLVDAWYTMLDRYGLENLVVEATVVNDVYNVAGSADRYVRLKRDLIFPMHDGTEIVLPAGTCCVGDIKSGRMKLNRSGYPAYWQNYSVQFAVYASAVPYDPDTGERQDWEWPIDQQYGLLFHLDVLEAMEGEVECVPYLVDISKGREGADLVMAAKRFAERKDIISMAPSSGREELGSLSNNMTANLLDSHPASDHDRESVRARLNALQRRGREFAEQIRADWPAGVPMKFDSHVHTVGEIRALKAMLEVLERQADQTRVKQPRSVGAGFGSVQRSDGEQNGTGMPLASRPVAARPESDEPQGEHSSLRDMQADAAEARERYRQQPAAGGDGAAVSGGVPEPDAESAPPAAPEPDEAAPPVVSGPSVNVNADLEGGAITDRDTIMLIRDRVNAMSPVQMEWFAALLKQAADAGYGFHFRDPGSDTDNVTARRFEIARGLLHLIDAGFATDDTDHVATRSMAALAFGSNEIAFDESVPTGAVLGRLTASTAVKFADECVKIAETSG